MASAERTENFDVPIEKFYKAITDYKNYPKFVDGLESIEVLQQTEQNAKVKFTLNLIKKVTYTINITHRPGTGLSWSLDSGDMMKVNNGGWKLKDLGGGKTEVTYHLEVELKGFFPGLGMVEKTLVNTNLPLNMKAFAKWAQGQA
jgi:coenzyme Q-binding protein COQ10